MPDAKAQNISETDAESITIAGTAGDADTGARAHV